MAHEKEWFPWSGEIPPKSDPMAYAEAFEDAVRAAFAQFYKSTVSERQRAIVSTMFSGSGWVPQDPGTVYVFTEHDWISDPWASTDEVNFNRWERAMEVLRSWGWTGAWWESYNSAVQTVFADGGS